MPNSWREGAVALGVNPLRAMLAVTLRAARPAIVAAAVLATRPRAGRGDHDLDGLGLGALLAEARSTGWCSSSSRCARWPRRSSTTTKGIGAPALRLGAVCVARCCCCSRAFVLSVGGYLIKLPLRKYQVRG